VSNVLIVPAAGRGSRLGSAKPKLLFPVNGRPMIDYILDLYRSAVETFVLVLRPAVEVTVREHCRARRERIEYAFQDPPTGMLDAVLAARPCVSAYRPSSVWITWCDQIAVHPKTVDAMAAESAVHPGAALIFPTIMRRRPYVHFERGRTRQIVGVRGSQHLEFLHRRVMFGPHLAIAQRTQAVLRRGVLLTVRTVVLH